VASLLRQKSYGVLLLDEFEKSDYRVRDLFLQILDEGQFTSAAGARLNARNLIIIATSNAAAGEIWELVRAGVDPASRREDLINSLIRQGAYRPELLNRFDAVVIFHPLSQEELRQVAALLLERVIKRLAEQGITLELTPELIDVVVQKGTNAVFGARPMLRFIQDEVERVIAERLLQGEIKSGSTVSFGPELNLQIVSS
jgi:ATP-dependent Clp protease ATP-binding subunit ClpA